MRSDSLTATNTTMRPTTPISPIAGMAWIADGACTPGPDRDRDWEDFDAIWFSDNTADSPASKMAVAVCRRCPVIQQCAAAALDHELTGVVAGIPVPIKGSRSEMTQARRQLSVIAGVEHVASERDRLRRRVRAMHERGMPVREIAAHMDVSPRTVQRMVEGRGARPKLSMEQARAIRADRAETGDSYQAIGQRWGVHRGTVAKIVQGRYYREDGVA